MPTACRVVPAVAGARRPGGVGGGELGRAVQRISTRADARRWRGAAPSDAAARRASRGEPAGPVMKAGHRPRRCSWARLAEGRGALIVDRCRCHGLAGAGRAPAACSGVGAGAVAGTDEHPAGGGRRRPRRRNSRWCGRVCGPRRPWRRVAPVAGRGPAGRGRRVLGERGLRQTSQAGRRHGEEKRVVRRQERLDARCGELSERHARSARGHGTNRREDVPVGGARLIKGVGRSPGGIGSNEHR